VVIIYLTADFTTSARRSPSVTATAKFRRPANSGSDKQLSVRRRRRATEANTCTSGCIVYLRKIIDGTIDILYNFNIFLQYRQNCSTFAYGQENVTLRLISYHTRITTTFRKSLR
jgi:hypothetical protein